MGWTKRFLTGFVAIPSLFVILNSPFLFIAFGICVVFWALYEWETLAARIVDGVRVSAATSKKDDSAAALPPPPSPGRRPILASVLLTHGVAIGIMAVGTWSGVYATFGASVAAAMLCTVVGALRDAVRRPAGEPPLALACALMLRVTGVAFCLCSTAHGLLLYRSGASYEKTWLTGGQGACLGAILLAFQADNGALFLGSALGSRAFAKAISPRKTWEGVAGAFLLPMLTVRLLHAVEHPAVAPLRGDVPLTSHLALAAAVAFASVAGDLTMSVVKRAAALSDSGSLIPGHGGLLDRLDSLMLALPVAYYVMRGAGYAFDAAP
jgi:CDP-diglyceride synthetase|tara:strand:- start:6014 stop:6985 length:972 start_codon:yes stop_codon:yes gene_type:complete